jgi:hypothetical protein
MNYGPVSIFMPKEERIKIYQKWLEKGWWTFEEGVCVFLKYDPETVNEPEICKKILRTTLGQYIYITASKSIRALNFILNERPHRALCKDWIEWAKQYPLIQLDPLLVKTLETVEKRRSKESYRPTEEKDTKIKFIAAAKVLVHLCSIVRLSDLTKTLLDSGMAKELPTDRTLREWLKSENIQLRETKPTKKEILEIEQKLSPFHPPSTTRK